MHRFTSLCARHPWLTLGLVLALIVLAVRPILRTGLALGVDASLGPDHPEVRRFEEFLARFGGGYPVVIAYDCGSAPRCASALDTSALAMVHAISRELAQSRFVTRVSSPATASLLVASADFGLEARRLVVDGVPTRDPSLRERALADGLWSRALVSTDGRVGAIAVELASTESAALLGIEQEIERALAPHAKQGFRFHQVGEATMWVAAHQHAVTSMLRVAVGTGCMLFLTLLLLLRSLPAVVASLATIGADAALTLAALPLLGWPRSELTEGAATVILVIGCASCVHFSAHYLKCRADSADVITALVAACRRIQAPCFLTCATSVASFVSLASGGLHSLTRFGVLAAVGVSLAFVLTFTLLPALLALLPVRPRSQRHARAWHDALSRLAGVGVRRSATALLLGSAAGLFGLVGVAKLRLELGLAALWDAEHPITRAIEFVSEHLEGPSRVEIELTLPAEAEAFDARWLGGMEEVERALKRIDGIEATRSIARLLRHADRVLRPEATGPGAAVQEPAAGELMTLVSAGDPGALDAWATLDGRQLRISAETRSLGTAERERMLARLEEVLERSAPPGWSHAISGPVALAVTLGREFRRSQTVILSASSLIVFALIGVYLRSLPWAVLAMLPNAVALLLLFGTMGHLGIPIDFGAAVVGPIAIGIAADDTIHFLTAYSRERRLGRDWLAGLHGAISGVGEAVITTSAALALGFLSMVASPIPSISHLGLLAALAIVAATVADLVLLPALIAVVATARSRLTRRAEESPGQASGDRV
jgi:predicted RND superfamily exporter protein